MSDNFKNTHKKKVKRNIHDSVFINLFSDKNNLLKLYKALINDYSNDISTDVSADNLHILNAESVFINDIYNDLSFVVDNELIIMVEAQSTYSVNIAIRMLLYLAKSLEKYIKQISKHNNITPLYSSKAIELPNIKLYTIYTGSKNLTNHSIDLATLIKKSKYNIQPDINLKIDVICVSDKENILGQYIRFCHIINKQQKQNIDLKYTNH